MFTAIGIWHNEGFTLSLLVNSDNPQDVANLFQKEMKSHDLPDEIIFVERVIGTFHYGDDYI